jgi:hypothetical protein
VSWLGWLGAQIGVVDPLNRRVLTFDVDGTPGRAISIEGGVRSVVFGRGDSMILSGRMTRPDAIDSVDALVHLVADGRSTRHAAIPFPIDPVGRRFSAVHAAPCGENSIAVVRSDTAAAWLVDKTSLTITASTPLPAELLRAGDTRLDSASPDPRRFHFTGLLGDDSGCIVLGLTSNDSDDPQFTLYWLKPGKPIRVGSLRTYLPLALRNDTLFSAEKSSAIGNLRIVSVTVSP